MANMMKWLFKSPRRLTLQCAGRTIELRYEAAGLCSGWAVLIDGRKAARFPELMTAQEQALRLADPTRVKAAA